MWANDKDASWLGPWLKLSHCWKCHTLIEGVSCPKCGAEFTPTELKIATTDGEIQITPVYTTQGAFSWTMHVLADLMKREWWRPVSVADSFSYQPPDKRPSQRMVIVVLFWTLFEHLMDRFFAVATSSLPPSVGADLLRCYSGIGSRMDRLYKLLFETTMEKDLVALGHADVYAHLLKVQDRRNRFVHGEAEAIDDTLVEEIVAKLHDVHSAWIALFNLRCTGNANAPPVWRDRAPF